MEKWERDYITSHLPDLIEDIDCNVHLTSHLIKFGVLARIDEENLEALGKSKGKMEKAKCLLEILLTREGAYRRLIKSLYSCGQTGALYTLLRGIKKKEHLEKMQQWDMDFADIYDQFLYEESVLNNNTQKATRTSNPGFKMVQIIIIFCGIMHANSSMDYKIQHAMLSTGKIPEPLRYYIPRTITISNELDPTIFQELTNGIFCVEGIELHQLSRLAKLRKNDIPDRSRNQIYDVTARLILLERHDHFEIIINKTAKLVHWVKYEDGNYFYVKSSRGSAVKSIAKFLKPERFKSFSELEFVQKYLSSSITAPVLLYDSPGMGKSVLLAELARKIRVTGTQREVVYLPISELIVNLGCSKRRCSSSAVKKFILDKKINKTNRMDQRVTESFLCSNDTEVELFLDAFDEVHETEKPTAHNILNFIMKDCKNIRMFITTRPHRKNELEEKFGVVGYNILPFNEANKLSFFLQFWETEHGVEITDEIQEFAEHCLKTLQFEMSGEEGDIAGIPLQCRMLADIYAEDAKRGGLIPADSHFQLNSIFKVYKHFVDRKFVTHCSDEDRQMFYDFHVREAVHTLFPKIYKESELAVPNYELIYRIGILEPLKSDSTTTAFSHRTFAEYFAAEHLTNLATSKIPMNVIESEFIELFFQITQMIGNKDNLFYENWLDDESFEDEWVKRNLSVVDRAYHWKKISFQHPAVCGFLNFFLSAMNYSSKDFGVQKNAIRKSNFYKSETLIGLLQSSLRINAVHMYLYLLDVYLDLEEFSFNHPSVLRFSENMQDTQNWILKEAKKVDLVNSLKEEDFPHLVATAAEHSSLNLVKLSYDLLESVTGKQLYEFSYYYRENPMYLALQRGHYPIFEFLLNMNSERYYEEPLIHWCVEHSYGKNAGDKVQIVKMVLDERPDLLNEPHPDYFDEVPILSRNINFPLIKLLIELGADISQTTEQKDNIAHLTTLYLSADEYHDLVELIISRNAKILFIQRDEWGQTPVHDALRKIDLKTETLELLANKCNVNFNDNFPLGGSELAIAIRNGRNSRVIKDIFRLGGDKEKLTKETKEELDRNYNM